ncbi:MAG: hypothetical protein ABEH88_06275 [Halobacteriales archaeon]
MAPPTHTPPAFARSDLEGGSVAGSIGLVALLAAGLVAASYPQVALAAAVGAVGTYLALRGMDTLRGRLGRRRQGSLAPQVAP